MNAPQYILSLRQPWAWLLVNGWKDIENRTWPTRIRGRVLIHAAKTMPLAEYNDCYWFVTAFAPRLGAAMPHQDALPRGGIVGAVTLLDCVTRHPSPWFVGPYGFEVIDAEVLPFVPCRGMLGFFPVPAPVRAAYPRLFAA